jgi:hypothetical protein
LLVSILLLRCCLQLHHTASRSSPSRKQHRSSRMDASK